MSKIKNSIKDSALAIKAQGLSFHRIHKQAKALNQDPYEFLVQSFRDGLEEPEQQVTSATEGSTPTEHVTFSAESPSAPEEGAIDDKACAGENPLPSPNRSREVDLNPFRNGEIIEEVPELNFRWIEEQAKTRNQDPYEFLVQALEEGIEEPDQPIGSDIEMAVRSLPNELHDAIVLAEYQGFSTEDIAEIFDISVQESRQRLDTAKRKIKEYLGLDGSEDKPIHWEAWEVDSPPVAAKSDQKLMAGSAFVNDEDDNRRFCRDDFETHVMGIVREISERYRNHVRDEMLTDISANRNHDSKQLISILTRLRYYDCNVFAHDPENINFIDVGILAPKTMWSWQSDQWVEECCDVHEEPIPPVNFNNVADSDDDNKPVILVYGADGSILASGKKSSLGSDKWESLKKRESNVPDYFIIPISDLVEIGNTDLSHVWSEVSSIQKPPSDVSSTARTHLKNRPHILTWRSFLRRHLKFDNPEWTPGEEVTREPIEFNTWLHWCNIGGSPGKRRGLLFICKDSSKPMKEQWTNFAFVFFPSMESRPAETTDMNWLSRGIAVPILCCDRNLVARTIDSILLDIGNHGERSGGRPPTDYVSNNVEFQIVPIETTVFIA